MNLDSSYQLQIRSLRIICSSSDTASYRRLVDSQIASYSRAALRLATPERSCCLFGPVAGKQFWPHRKLGWELGARSLYIKFPTVSTLHAPSTSVLAHLNFSRKIPPGRCMASQHASFAPTSHVTCMPAGGKFEKMKASLHRAVVEWKATVARRPRNYSVSSERVQW